MIFLFFFLTKNMNDLDIQKNTITDHEEWK